MTAFHAAWRHRRLNSENHYHFSNHRKYESVDVNKQNHTGIVVSSYVNWINQFGGASGRLAFIALVTAVFTVIPISVGVSLFVITLFLLPSLFLIRLFYPIGFERRLYENETDLAEYLTEFQREIGARLAIQ